MSQRRKLITIVVVIAQMSHPPISPTNMEKITTRMNINPERRPSDTVDARRSDRGIIRKESVSIDSLA